MTTIPRRTRASREGAPRRRRTAAPDNFSARAAEWYRNKLLGDHVKKLIDGDRDKTKPGAALGLRLEVLEQVKRSGQPDENGSRFYYFTEPVEGLSGLKAQRATSPTFDTEIAENILSGISDAAVSQCKRVVLQLEPDKHHLVEQALRDAGIYDECVAARDTEIDQDAVFGYHQLHRDELTVDMMNEITGLAERWSLIPIEADPA